ncbi:MAG TPA: phosphatase PAP2 family protein [Anaerolineaceae bacterium]|nr:phosphatase PAP2 family protein [Anaerolineaceae bacterium]
MVPHRERRYRAYIFQFIVLAMILAFVALALLASTQAYFSLDPLITHEIQENSSIPFQDLMLAVSWLGYLPQIVIISCFFVAAVWLFGLQWEAVVLTGAGIVSTMLNLLIKEVVHRPRPSTNLVHVFENLSSYSFPSGHVMYYTAFFGFLFFICFIVLKHSWRRTVLLILFGSLVILVGISRIYLGEHWASDVIGGYLGGALVLAAAVQIYRWGKPRFFVTQPVASDPGPQDVVQKPG